MKIKVISINALIALYTLLSLNSLGQLKMLSSGLVGVGTFNPLVRLHVNGDYALFTANTTPINSAAFIRCNNNFSSASSPDYTWYFNDLTGLFHPANNVIGFTLNTVEVMRLQLSSTAAVIQGDILANGNLISSDRRFKINVNGIKNPLEKILKLRGVSYDYNRTEFKKSNFDSLTTLGFIAQEVKEVIPEVVRQGKDGYLALNYSAIIPLLVEAIKMQEIRISDLQSQIGSSDNNNNAKSLTTNINSLADNINSNAKPTLFQNAPNPFNVETVIRYSLPQNAKSANLYIYDIGGNKKKSVNIEIKSEGSVKIAANELGQGVYFYSLIVDGIICDSKTMLITE